MPLKVSDGIGSWIKDFKKSDAPQFKGKSEKERRDQAIAAYLSAKRGPQNEETPSGKQVKQAIGIARDKRYAKGNMTGAVKAMDKINPKLSGHPKVKGELQKQNEDAFSGGAVERGKVKTGPSKARLDAIQKQKDAEKKAKDDAISKLRGDKTNEEFVFKVDVEGLPSMFMKGNSPGEVKTHLRKLVKQPSMVKSVERQTKHDVKKQRRKQAKLGEAVSADKKVEKYTDADGKVKYRMVAVTKEAMNRRDRLRARLHAVGKDMEKTNVAIKKAAGIQDKPKVRLGSDGKPYKSRYEEVDPARDEGKPGAVKHAKKMTPGQQNEKITIGKIRKMAYKTGKTLGDVQAVKKKKVGKRIARRAAGKLVGRALGALFK